MEGSRRLSLGIVTPVVHMNPRFDPPAWEAAGGIEDIVAVAEAAERIGIDWVSCSEHIAVPENASGVRGGRYWDPFTTLSFIAAHTRRVRLLTHMAVLPYHHPLELVKRLGTLDVASHGRVVLGVGVGSLEPEFDLLGHAFEGRGERSDDAIRAIRASWGARVPEYQGSHYRFSGFIVEPSGLPRSLEIWVGGRTRRSLRRAATLGDAWMPFRLLLPELQAILSEPRTRSLLAQREKPLGLIFAPEPPLDPIGQHDATATVVEEYMRIGATGLSLRFRHESRTHYIEQMEAMATLAGELTES